MSRNGFRNSRRPVLLLVMAALLTAAALVSAIGAQGGSPVSNKADGYGGGGPLPPPTNPKTHADCDKMWGKGNPSSEARECNAKVTFQASKKSCAKKKTKSARAACL